MNVEIHLENHYFPWAKTEGNNLKCWLKGDLFYNDTLLEGPEIISLFSGLPSFSEIYHDALKDFLLGCNGSFALVIETRDSLLCVVDRIRSIPLFYAKTDTRFIISDDANFIKDQIKPLFNKKNGAEFLVTGYVTGRETLFDGIYQIQAGEYMSGSRTDCHIATSFYHHYWHEDFFSDSEEELLKRLDEVFIHVFQRLITSTKGKGLQIVVPLSGGLDSRIIVAILKRLGVDDVICFSYGQKGNYEAEISKKVAEALGYQWHFVEYIHDKWYQCYNSDEALVFERYAGNLSSLPNFQDFLAVQELLKEGKIPKKSVFVPGHSADMLAGSWIPQTIEEIIPDYNQFIIHTLQKHYLLWPWNESGGEELETIFRKRIQQSVGDIDIHDAESLANAIEYEFFGYAWRIPFWNTELIDFFLKVPLKYRLNRYLYINYARNVLLIDNLKKLQEIDCTTTILTNPNKTFKKKCEDIINNNKILKKSWLKIYFLKRRLFAYNNDPYFGMIRKEKFLKLFSGKQYTDSFLAINYLEKFIPSPLDLIRIKKRF
jgi:asparagine synthase (glutamine-hydrolysing)